MLPSAFFSVEIEFYTLSLAKLGFFQLQKAIKKQV